MAKGHPDYFGQAIFPHYGSTKLFNCEKPVAGLETIEMLRLDLKGSISSGLFYISPIIDFDPSLNYVQILVDGININAFVFSFWNTTFGYNTLNNSFKLLTYDVVNKIYAFEVLPGINFTTSLVLQITSISPTSDYTIVGGLQYYHIE